MTKDESCKNLMFLSFSFEGKALISTNFIDAAVAKFYVM
jgi:hypothetical protein